MSIFLMFWAGLIMPFGEHLRGPLLFDPLLFDPLLLPFSEFCYVD